MSAKRRAKMSKDIFAVCQQVVSVSGIQGRFRKGFEILLVAAMLYDLQQFRWELISLAQQGSIPGAFHESVDDAEYRVCSGAWWWSGSASDVVFGKEEKVERLTTNGSSILEPNLGRGMPATPLLQNDGSIIWRQDN